MKLKNRILAATCVVLMSIPLVATATSLPPPPLKIPTISATTQKQLVSKAVNKQFPAPHKMGYRYTFKSTGPATAEFEATPRQPRNVKNLTGGARIMRPLRPFGTIDIAKNSAKKGDARVTILGQR